MKCGILISGTVEESIKFCEANEIRGYATVTDLEFICSTLTNTDYYTTLMVC